MSETMDPIPVVLGGYVNGYGIIRSLHERRIRDIHLIDVGRPAACGSKYVTRFIGLDDEGDESLLSALRDISAAGRRIIPYPTNDAHVTFLARYADELQPWCFVPVNQANAEEAQDKLWQYERASAAGVTVPLTVALSSTADLPQLAHLQRPIIIKPAQRRSEGHLPAPFRNVILTDESVPPSIAIALDQGWSLLASEVIPGADSQIYAYTAYRTSEGVILGEWGGRKLSQHPTGFGVYATATNESVQGLFEQGRKAVEAIDAVGIVEPEFKVDPRSGRLVLMEINLRSMMWHRVGALSGVNLPALQYDHARGAEIPFSRQSEEFVSSVYFGHELANLIGERRYWQIFRANVLAHKARQFSFWNAKDPVPFMLSLEMLGKLVVKSCVQRFRRG